MENKPDANVIFNNNYETSNFKSCGAMTTDSPLDRTFPVNQVQCYLASKAEAKEKELKTFLFPRHVTTEQESPQNIPIQSTVPAVRPLCTLIGGTAQPVDGSLLGPAQSTSSRQDPKSDTVHHSDDDSNLFSRIPVDPSVNLVLSRLCRAQRKCNSLVSANQAELQSFTFTQNSQNGKRIMMRIRVLEEENQELAKMNQSGPMARLRTELALRRHLVRDVKQSFADAEFLAEEIENETELLGSTLLVLQERLELTKKTARLLAAKLDSLEPGRSAEIFKAANWFPFDSSTTNAVASVSHPQSESNLQTVEHPTSSIVSPPAAPLPTSSENAALNCNEDFVPPSKRFRAEQDHDSRPKSRPDLPVDGPQRTDHLDSKFSHELDHASSSKDNSFLTHTPQFTTISAQAPSNGQLE